MRQVAQRLLESRGYRVLDADGGEAALEVPAHALGAIDLLLTDVIMPGMNGRQLAQSAREADRS